MEVEYARKGLASLVGRREAMGQTKRSEGQPRGSGGYVIGCLDTRVG